jgi:hypothetical protein
VIEGYGNPYFEDNIHNFIISNILKQKKFIFYNRHKVMKTGGKMGFFDSEVVQQEAKQLFEDYQSLTQLGSEFGKFDREGKKIFIEKMEDMMDRYRIFVKRFELSEDFMAKMTIEQLKTQLNQFGTTPEQMFQQMHSTLERMKKEI